MVLTAAFGIRWRVDGGCGDGRCAKYTIGRRARLRSLALAAVRKLRKYRS